MSYILDALKKADAERERDAAAVPDLYAQADATRGGRAAARPGRWLLAGLGAAGLILAALAWRWFSAAPADSAAPAPMAQAPAAWPVIVEPAPAPTPVRAPAPVIAPAPVVAAPAIAQAAAPALAAPTPPPRPAVAVAAPVREHALAKPAAPASAAGAETRLPSWAELPPELRSQLPALAVGGSVYSPNAASRMVILNGQVFREGDKPVEGLSIEQIRLKSSVLAFRGQRFELKH